MPGLFGEAFVESLEVGGDEPTIFANEFSVEPNFSATVIGALNENEVPMDTAAVAVVGFVVGISGSEVERAADFFIEEGIEHGVQDAVVGTE